MATNIKQKLKKENILFFLFSLYVTFVIILGNIYWKKVVFNFAQFLILTALIILVTFLLAKTIFTLCKRLNHTPPTAILSKWRFPFQRYVISVLSIFICWIPVLIICYPTIITADSLWQWQQALGISSLSNHHPIYHTALIWLSQQISKLFSLGQVNGSLAACIYSLIQMTILASIFAYTLNVLEKMKISTILLYLTWVYYAIFPLNSMFSVYMEKNVIWSSLILLLTILMYRLCNRSENYLTTHRHLIFFIVLLILIILFRNTGLFIVLTTLLFLILSNKKHRKKLLFALFTVLSIWVMQSSIQKIAHIPHAKFSEALGLPINQISLVVIKGKPLKADESELIEAVLPIEDIKKSYSPRYSDPIKFHENFNADAIRSNLVKYVYLWGKLFMKNPTTYLEASANLTIGYWYPDVRKGSISSDISQKETLFQAADIDIYSHSTLYDYFWGDGVRNNYLLSWTWSIGFMVIIMLFLCISCVLTKGNKYLWIFLPNIISWCILLVATPSFCETRYVYSIFIAIPFYWGVFLQESKQ